MQIPLMKFYGPHQFSESFDHLYLEQESESHPKQQWGNQRLYNWMSVIWNPILSQFKVKFYDF